jgi:hypothetical protein
MAFDFFYENTKKQMGTVSLGTCPQKVVYKVAWPGVQLAGQLAGSWVALRMR